MSKRKSYDPELAYTGMGILLYSQNWPLPKSEPQDLFPKNLTLGTRVRTTQDLFMLPKGSTGVVDEDYGSGVMVAWDDYPYHDGFSKSNEFYLLEVIG